VPGAFHSQELSPRRNPGADVLLLGCPRGPKPPQPPASDRDRARRLTTLAYEAAINGDQRAARDLFRQAARLDPASEEIAYQLGRAYEALGMTNDALTEYCRYTSLAPSGPDAADVAERIRRLGPPGKHPLPDSALANFRSGVSLLDHHRFADAEREFSRAIARAPQLADAFYDRALALIAANKPEPAERDLERYLDLSPGAPDRSLVLRRIAALHRQAIRPSQALARGLIIPGGGQMYTGRPALGLAVLALTGGTVYYAARAVPVTRTTTYTDPFGARYSSSFRSSDRPHLALGIAGAAGVSLLAALEAYRYASRGAAGGSDARAATLLHTSLSGSLHAVPAVWTAGGHFGAGIAFSLATF
jgi:tetratricopeptide (TPR) repeat protein